MKSSPSPALSPLSQYLKILREGHDTKQAEIAKYIGITRQTYSHYETSRIIPPTESLFKIPQFYDVSLDRLVHLASLSSMGYKRDIDPRTVQNNESNLQSDFDNLYADFLNNCSGMKTAELKKWLKTEDMELVHYYHKLSRQNRVVVSYLIRLMALKDL